MGQREKGVERCRGKKEKARDNKSGVNADRLTAELEGHRVPTEQNRADYRGREARRRGGVDKQSRLLGWNFLGSSETSLKHFY